MVLDFLNLGIFPPKFNNTHIVLIPKVKEPKRITECRSISLCNVVNDTQSAFVHGKLITDNVLVAFETMHHIC